MSRITEEPTVIVLVKGQERYLWLFTDDQRSDVLRSFGRMACDPDLTFSWYDAAVMSQKIRNQEDQSC